MEVDLKEDSIILRALAAEYLHLANSDRNLESLRLHAAVNDLHVPRPAVLIDELPWHELNGDGELDLRCTDPWLRDIEWSLRTTLYKARHLPADMVVPPYLAVRKVIHSTGNGLRVEEKTLASDRGNHIVSHEYVDILKTDADLDRIHLPKITYDRDETMRRYDLLGELVGDIIPVRLKGVDYFHVITWDEIAAYRGVTDLLMDLVDRPEFSHRMVRLLTDTRKAELDQYEALGLLDADCYDLHCTAARTSDIPSRSYDGSKVTRKDIWGRGTAQVFASVSKGMHEEFDIDYMIETIGQCGLAYYGCCEPLDRKIDILDKIPNLRKISITPWASVDVAAEAIGKKYVLASKPNPASVAVPILDEDALRKEISQILGAIRRNGCSADIVLKDISTCGHNPDNLFEWARIVMEMVRNA
jgi:hypothetical protein